MWPQHLEKIGTRCSRMGAGRAASRNSGSGQEEVLGWGGEQWGSACHSGENTWLPSSPHFSKAGATVFANWSSQTFSRIPESALRVGTIRHRVELGRYPERLPAGQKYVLAAPQAPPCYRVGILPPWQKPVHPEVCIQTSDREQGRKRSYLSEKA